MDEDSRLNFRLSSPSRLELPNYKKTEAIYVWLREKCRRIVKRIVGVRSVLPSILKYEIPNLVSTVRPWDSNEETVKVLFRENSLWQISRVKKSRYQWRNYEVNKIPPCCYRK